jgi:hypothetical protein
VLIRLRKILTKLVDSFRRYFNSIFKVRSKKTIAITAIVVVLILITVIGLWPTGNSKQTGESTMSKGGNIISRFVDRATEDNDTKSTAPKDQVELNIERTSESLEQVDEMRSRVDRAVKFRRLSEEQANLIKAKLYELEKFFNDVASKKADERRDLIDEKEQELKEWAEENNISRTYVRI